MLGYVFCLLCGIAVGISVMCLLITGSNADKKADQIVQHILEQELQKEEISEKQ